jgi:ABC-2 type transport system ATP-binding protein
VLISSHVLAEVAQTVDQVLIINRGRLVVESSLEQLTAQVGGAVRVRTPDVEPLRQALEREQLQTTASNEHVLLVHGTTSEHVGDVALAAGVPVHELITEGSSLEQIFLELTGGDGSAVSGATPSAAVPPETKP